MDRFLKVINKAVALALNYPSACNRQHARVHCIANPVLRDRVLRLQQGNRGFGCDADKLLVVTGDVRDVCWLEERHDLYTNVGIFLMNLCYALHYHKVACCILNWSVSPEKDKELRQVVSIPGAEDVVALVACGDALESFSIASSPRRNVDEVLAFHR